MRAARTWTWGPAAIGVLLLSTVSPARAADPEALIREGNELRKNGRNEEALPLFQAAYAAERTPRTAGQLGLSEMSVGYWAEAEAHLAEALDFPSHPWVAKNIQGLQSMLAKARQKLAEISVIGSPPGSEVRINGHLSGALPLPKPLRLAEGRIDIQVTASGYRTEVRTLSAKGGEKLQVTVNLEHEAVAALPAPARAIVTTSASEERPQTLEAPRAPAAPVLAASEEASSPSRTKWPTIATASAGAVMIGFTAVETYLWRHTENAFNDHTPAIPRGSGPPAHDCGEQEPMRGGPGCQSLYDQAVRDRTLAIVGLAAGAALGVTSILLWRSSHEGSSQQRRLSCAPNAAERGVECRWRF